MTEQISNKELAEKLYEYIGLYIPDEASDDVELAGDRLAAMPDAVELYINKADVYWLNQGGRVHVCSQKTDHFDTRLTLYAQPQLPAPDDESDDVHEHLHNTIALLTKQLIKAERQSDKETIKRYCVEFAEYLDHKGFDHPNGTIFDACYYFLEQQSAEAGE